MENQFRFGLIVMERGDRKMLVSTMFSIYYGFKYVTNAKRIHEEFE